MTDKRLSLREAIATYVHDGMSVAIEGFTAFICFAAGHEIIRQRRRDLTLIRMTPDLIYDQMIAAGVARKLVFSYLGNPGVGALHCLRRAVEAGMPAPLELEEYSHYGLVGRYIAGATRLPFYPLRSYLGSEMPFVNNQIKFMQSPYGDEKVAVVPPINPDIAILHAQRADSAGNTQLWGLLGVQKEVAFAARKVIVVVEEMVDEAVIRADPNRTLIPGLIVDAVVHVPYGRILHTSRAIMIATMLFISRGISFRVIHNVFRPGWMNGSTAWRIMLNTCASSARRPWNVCDPAPLSPAPSIMELTMIERLFYPYPFHMLALLPGASMWKGMGPAII